MRRLINEQKTLRTLRKTPMLLALALSGITQTQAQTLRDGPDGWSVLEIVCHLYDLEELFTERVRDLLAGPEPVFQTISNAELAARGNYPNRVLVEVLAELAARRAALIALLESLTEEQWLLGGTHPDQGPATLLDVAVNVGLHDIDHIEQIARVTELTK